MAKNYKLKTHKGTAKRFRVTGTGKIIRKKMQLKNNAHLKSKRKSQRKAIPENFVLTSKGNIRRIKKLLHN